MIAGVDAVTHRQVEPRRGVAQPLRELRLGPAAAAVRRNAEAQHPALVVGQHRVGPAPRPIDAAAMVRASIRSLCEAAEGTGILDLPGSRIAGIK